jgi:hypothetical protein
VFRETRRELGRSLIFAGLFLVHLGCLTCVVVGYLDSMTRKMTASAVDAVDEDCRELGGGTTMQHGVVFGRWL